MHIGHLIVATEARWQLGLDEVWLVPALEPPHKPGGPRLDPELRARLVQAAVADDDRLGLSRVELDRPPPSYTVDTLGQLTSANPGSAFWFIMGADQLLGLPTWRDPQGVLELARLAVVPRGSADPEELSTAAEDIAPGRVDWVSMPEIGISSSLIRRRMEDGRPITHLVPPTVERELRRAGLVASRTSMEPREGIESRRSS